MDINNRFIQFTLMVSSFLYIHNMIIYYIIYIYIILFTLYIQYNSFFSGLIVSLYIQYEIRYYIFKHILYIV